jgi:hypothetical protein
MGGQRLGHHREAAETVKVASLGMTGQRQAGPEESEMPDVDKPNSRTGVDAEDPHAGKGSDDAGEEAEEVGERSDGD